MRVGAIERLWSAVLPKSDTSRLILLFLTRTGVSNPGAADEDAPDAATSIGINSSPRAASSGSELDPDEPSVRLLFRPALSTLLLVPFFFLTAKRKQELRDTPWWLLAGQPHTVRDTHRSTVQDRRYTVTDGSFQVAAVASTGLSCLNDTC